jgi:hypothetical protein
MIERVAGTLLSPEDAEYVANALLLLRDLLTRNGSRPTGRLDAVTDRLRRTTGVKAQNASPNARIVGAQTDSGDDSWHATIDTSQAARILGISGNGVRDLSRRGRLPARRVGGRWVYPVEAVMRRAERRTHT